MTNAQANQLIDWKPNATLTDTPMVDNKEQAAAMRHFAAGVTIITSATGERKAGLTATAMCSVTIDPPRLVVFVNKNVLANELILESGHLCVNILCGAQEDIARVFAGMVPEVRGEARFGHGRWARLVTGSPVLAGALASFDCRVVKVFDESTHHAFLCEVLATQESPGEALVYLNGAFVHITHQQFCV